MPTINEILKCTPVNKHEAEDLLAHILKTTRADIMANPERKPAPALVKKFQTMIRRRQNHEPMAYILGTQPFCGREFIVNKHVLIPRPETETLVETVKDDMKMLKMKPSVILDIGTGSGCIAVTLATHMPKATVIATDISDAALRIARINAKKYRTRIVFIKDNVLGIKVQHKIHKMQHPENQFLYIVANLPYLAENDKKSLQKDVVGYEPHQALFAGKDGTRCIKKLFKQLQNGLKTNGRIKKISLCLECDPSHIVILSQDAKKHLPVKKMQIKKDLCGRKRFLLIKC